MFEAGILLWMIFGIFVRLEVGTLCISNYSLSIATTPPEVSGAYSIHLSYIGVVVEVGTICGDKVFFEALFHSSRFEFAISSTSDNVTS